jgi:hypothetical protein
LAKYRENKKDRINKHDQYGICHEFLQKIAGYHAEHGNDYQRRPVHRENIVEMPEKLMHGAIRSLPVKPDVSATSLARNS